MDMQTLIRARHELRDETARHALTLKAFRREGVTGFSTRPAAAYVVEGDGDRDEVGDQPNRLHLTSSITCFESLDSTDSDEDEPFGPHEPFRAYRDFVEAAIADPTEWTSEGGAKRYCLVRGGAPIARLMDLFDRGDDADMDLAARTRAFLKKRFRHLWLTLVTPESERQAIFETTRPWRDKDKRDPAVPLELDDDGDGANYEQDETDYPPSSFLTYWALLGARALGLFDDDDVIEKVNISTTWLEAQVGHELAAFNLDSPNRDPQSIAWAIAGLVMATRESVVEWTNTRRVLVAAGLKALFAQQRSDGTWPLGTALFHYPEAGNAYCYPYETLAELLYLGNCDPAFGSMLKEHLGSLLHARDGLNASRLVISTNDDVYGWNSGHSPRRPGPESWATAAALRFLQELRRFVASVAGERAATALGAARVADDRPLDAFGHTFATPHSQPAGSILTQLFLPGEVGERPGDAPTDVLLRSTQLRPHPDHPIDDGSDGRSAILYGPPGTGKTTLAKLVASALKRQFVEITAADFLDEGLDSVSRRADEIFELVEQLNGAVVLFDEIDEIVLKRDETTDSVSRFFTTTMLPRLAHLWEGNRSVFFLNTNRMPSIDPAVARSQRFDAAVLVMPPSLDKKQAMLGKVGYELDVDRVLAVLRRVQEAADKDVPDGEVNAFDFEARWAWFPFLRYNQIETLQKLLEEGEGPGEAELLELVAGFGKKLRRSDWALSLNPPIG